MALIFIVPDMDPDEVKLISQSEPLRDLITVRAKKKKKTFAI